MATDTALAPTNPGEATALDKLLRDPGALATIPIETVTELHRIHRLEIEDGRKLEFQAAFKRAQDLLTAIDIPKVTEGDRGSRFAKTEAICRVLDPVLVDEGFSWSFSDEDSQLEGHIKVVMLLRLAGHVEGHAYNVPAWDGRGPKGAGVMTPLQASGAMRTYSERRLRMSVFGLHLVDDDTDGKQPPTDTITEDQLLDLEAKITEKGIGPGGRVKLLDWLGVDDLANLPAGKLRAATDAIERKR